MKTARFEIRTDLALEEREGLKEQAKEVSGVSFRKWKGKTEDVQITEVKVLNEAGAETLGKPIGSYLTLEADRLLLPDEDFHSEVSDELANVLKELAEHALGKKEGEEKEAATPTPSPTYFPMKLLSAVYEKCNGEQFEAISELDFYASMNLQPCEGKLIIRPREKARVCYLIFLMGETLHKPDREKWRKDIMNLLGIDDTYYKSKYKEPVSDFPSDSNQIFAKEMQSIFR